MAYLASSIIVLLLDLIISPHAQRIDISDLDPCIDEIQCSILPNNVRFPYPGDCTKYYTCISGQLSVQECRRGQRFDYTTLSCNARRQAQCYPPCSDDVDEDEAGISPVTPTGKPTPDYGSTRSATSASTAATAGKPTPDYGSTRSGTTASTAATTTHPVKNKPTGHESPKPSSTQKQEVVTQLPVTTRHPPTGSSLSAKASTVAPTDPVQRCAPKRDMCTPGERFGFANDCSSFYECVQPNSPTGRYYVFRTCWSNQGFDVVTRSCQSMSVAKCEENCPGLPRGTTPTVTMVTTPESTTTPQTATASTKTELITPAIETTSPRTTLYTTTPNDVISASNTVTVHRNTTPKISTSSVTPSQPVTDSKQTTTPRIISDPVEQCAPPFSACTPGEKFGYAENCQRFYQCLGDGDSSQYYRLRSCWNNQGFDIYLRTCVEKSRATCESKCPGYIRTTPSSTPTPPGYTSAATVHVTSATIAPPDETTDAVTTSSVEPTTVSTDLTTISTGEETSEASAQQTSHSPTMPDLTTSGEYSTVPSRAVTSQQTASATVTTETFTTPHELMSTQLYEDVTATTEESDTGHRALVWDTTAFEYPPEDITTEAVAATTPETSQNTATERQIATKTTATASGVVVTTESSDDTGGDLGTGYTGTATGAGTLGNGFTTQTDVTPAVTDTSRGYSALFLSSSQPREATSGAGTPMPTFAQEGTATTTVASTETTSFVAIRPLSPCNRTEPCPFDRRIADPENCSVYYDCPQGYNWEMRSCGNYSFDVVLEICVENATCAEPCQSGSSVVPVPEATTLVPEATTLVPEATTLVPEATTLVTTYVPTITSLLVTSEDMSTSKPATREPTFVPMTSEQPDGRMMTTAVTEAGTTTSVELTTTSVNTTREATAAYSAVTSVPTPRPVGTATPVPVTSQPTAMSAGGEASTATSQPMTTTVTSAASAEAEETSVTTPAGTPTSDVTSGSTVEATTLSLATSDHMATSTTPDTADSTTAAHQTITAITSITTSIQPGVILDHQITIESEDALEGVELTSQCSFVVEPPGAPYRVNWFLNGSPLRPSGRIHIISLVPSSSRRSTQASRLTFDPVSAQDTGILECYVQLTGNGVESEKSLPINVLALPTTALSPMTAVVHEGEEITLRCQATLQSTGHPKDGATPLISWYRDGVAINENEEAIVGLAGVSELTSSPQADVVYSCAAYNANVTQGEGNQSYASIYVIQANDPICDEDVIDSVTWPETGAGIVYKQPCPGDMIGEVTRACVAQGADRAKWEEPDMINCVNQEFVDISQQITRLEEGVGGPEDSERITESLEGITNSTTALPPGDINSATDSVTSLATIRRDDAALSVDLSENEMTSMVTTVSNLISEMNEESWDDVLEEYPDKAVSLMWTVDTYGDIFAHQLAINDTMSIVSPMLVVQVHSLGSGSTRDLRYPQTDEWPDDESHNDVIIIQKETLDQISLETSTDKISVSSCYYKSLDKILPSYHNTTDNAYLSSRVLSLSVGGRSHNNLDPPIQMSFSHGDVSDDNVSSCSYWDYTGNTWSTEGCHVIKSNSSQTTCECDHLTNFAILVSKKPVSGEHAHALGIISIVGCVISIAGLFLTILIYISIWKHVKSHHAVVLINLCIALLIANLLFVTGVDKAEHEDLCTAIAALLHYFYLAAFCIMLVEGVQLVLYIIYVFHVRRKRETTGMLLLAWVFPAVVVGICLGISKTEGYGTEDYCWLDADSWLFWAFNIPIIVIIIINIGILVAVLRRISTSKLRQADNKNKHQKIRSGAWNIVVIMPILGITWIFGIFSLNSDILAFQYIFAISNSLQGLFIFIFHAICNKKKGNYQVKTNSQKTQRSRLKSDSSGKNSSKIDRNAQKGIIGKLKKNRHASTENTYDTIPAENVRDSPPPNGKLAVERVKDSPPANGKLAVENEYTTPDDNRLSCFDTFMLPDEIKDKSFETFNGSSGINHNPFDTYIIPEEKKYNSNNRFGGQEETRRESADETYLVPLSKQDSNGGFTNPVFDDIAALDQVDVTLNKGRHIQDTSLRTSRDVNKNNAAPQPRRGLPRTATPTQEGDITPPSYPSSQRSAGQDRSGPPPYRGATHGGYSPRDVRHVTSESPSPQTGFALSRDSRHTGPYSPRSRDIRHIDSNPSSTSSLPRDMRHIDSTSSLPRDVRHIDSTSSLPRDVRHAAFNSPLSRDMPHGGSNSSLTRDVLQSSLQRGLQSPDSKTSLQRAARKVEEMRPDECIDMSLRKQDSARNTPKSSPYLPRSTPFLSKHAQK